jgi:hypothetical protein
MVGTALLLYIFYNKLRGSNVKKKKVKKMASYLKPLADKSLNAEDY